MLTTDWQSPTSGVLARLKDVRARQYWDPRHLVAQRLAADARDPQPRQACCLRDNFLWDLAALYPPGVEWKDALPPAVFFNGPVVKRRAELETALDFLGVTSKWGSQSWLQPAFSRPLPREASLTSRKSRLKGGCRQDCLPHKVWSGAPR